VLEPYRAAARARVEASPDGTDLFRELYADLHEHGFDLVPYDVALEYTRPIGTEWGPRLEYLIDVLLAPRGFWGPQATSVPLLSSTHPEMLHCEPPPRT
jgi:hypothetical protein